MIVPVRGLVLELAVTDQVTLALPAPLVGEQVSQVPSLLEAVQEQVEAEAVTDMLPVAAVALGDAPVGEIENVHGGGWETPLVVALTVVE